MAGERIGLLGDALGQLGEQDAELLALPLEQTAFGFAAAGTAFLLLLGLVLAFVGSLLPLVGGLVAFVGSFLPLVGPIVAFVGGQPALQRDLVVLIGGGFTFIDPAVASVELAEPVAGQFQLVLAVIGHLPAFLQLAQEVVGDVLEVLQLPLAVVGPVVKFSEPALEFVGGPVPFVGGPVALVGDAVPFLGRALAFVESALTFVGGGGALIGVGYGPLRGRGRAPGFGIGGWHLDLDPIVPLRRIRRAPLRHDEMIAPRRALRHRLTAADDRPGRPGWCR